MAKKRTDNDSEVVDLSPVDTRFKITKGKIRQMYKDDNSVRRNVNKDIAGAGQSIVNLSLEGLKSSYYANSNDYNERRNYSAEAYKYYPVYANIIDYLSNMYCWRYTYTPRLVKDRSADYAEIYQLMGEVVDGLSIETTYPMVLTKLFTYGAVYLVTHKNTSSKTITTFSLPAKYCRPNAESQFGFIVYQFDYSYFDSLGLNAQEIAQILELYPPIMAEQYKLYLQNKTANRWQVIDPRYAAGFMLNDAGFPTKLYGLFGITQYQQYADNELKRNGQLLDKIVSHQLPTWQDRLIVEIDEMAELHQSMSKIISKNNHVRLLSTFGDIKVHSIGQDQTKENKTMENAYNSIYDNVGLNHSLFNGDSVEALRYALIKDKSLVWRLVEQLTNFYNVVINNSFNFSGYQCNLNMLPITYYDENETVLRYKDGATLGVSILEYIVASGIKQINIDSKLQLEKYLKLDELRPLSTSYTQVDNSKEETAKKEVEKEKTEEVEANGQNT